MNCSKCGANLTHSDIYCPECGTKVLHKKLAVKTFPIPKKIVWVVLIVISVIVLGFAIKQYSIGKTVVAQWPSNVYGFQNVLKQGIVMEFEERVFEGGHMKISGRKVADKTGEEKYFFETGGINANPGALGNIQYQELAVFDSPVDPIGRAIIVKTAQPYQARNGFIETGLGDRLTNINIEGVEIERFVTGQSVTYLFIIEDYMFLLTAQAEKQWFLGELAKEIAELK